MYKKYNQVIDFFKKNKGYLTDREYRALGIHPRDIKYLLDNNLIINIRSGLYRLFDLDVSNSDFIDVSYAVPNGVICLLSALAYYNLTTYVPSCVWVAMPRRTWKKRINFPKVQYITMKDIFYNEGITNFSISGYNVKIYSVEKTICDCLRFRNKIVGEEILKECLREYLKLKNKDLNTLFICADKLQVKTILEAWLKPMV